MLARLSYVSILIVCESRITVLGSILVNHSRPSGITVLAKRFIDSVTNYRSGTSVLIDCGNDAKCRITALA